MEYLLDSHGAIVFNMALHAEPRRERLSWMTGTKRSAEVSTCRVQEQDKAREPVNIRCVSRGCG